MFEAALFAMRGSRNGGDETPLIVGFFIIFGFVMLIVAVYLANSRSLIVWRNGLPFCPFCNRQVSLRTPRNSPTRCSPRGAVGHLG
jgi:hypothetical protein